MTSQKIYEFAIAKQSAKGVPATAAEFKTRITGGGIMPVPDVQKLAETGRNRLSRTVVKLTIGVDGNPEFAVREDLAGLLLWGALGTKSVNAQASTTLAAAAVATDTNIKVTSVTGMAVGDILAIGAAGEEEYREIATVGTAGGAGTGIDLTSALESAHDSGDAVVEAEAVHTITPANSLPYFTCWHQKGDMVWEKFEDCKVSQLVFTSEAASQVGLRMTATLVGTKSRSLDESTYDTEVAVPFSDGDVFVHHHASGLLLVEGAAVSRMERVELTINNAAARQYGDSIFPDDISEGGQSITIATRERVVSAALWNRMIYGSATPASGTLPTSDVVELGGGGLDFMWRRQTSPERSIRFQTGDRVQISGIGAFAPGTGDDPLKQEPTYEILDPDSGDAITALVTNGHAAY